MIENRIETHGIAHSLVAQLQQIIPSLKVDDSRWRKEDELLEIAFYQAQIEVQSLQDSMNRLQEQLHGISFLQKDLASAMDVQTIVLRVYELIPKYTDVERAVLYLISRQLGTQVFIIFKEKVQKEGSHKQ